MSKICNNCLSPAPPDTEHRIDGKVVCHDCVVEYKLTPDTQKKEETHHAD